MKKSVLKKYLNKPYAPLIVMGILVIFIMSMLIIPARGDTLWAISSSSSTKYHSNRVTYYRLRVEKDHSYRFTVSRALTYLTDTPSGMLYSNFLKMQGIKGTSFEFEANHDGYYYLTLYHSKDSLLTTRYYETTIYQISEKNYFNFGRFSIFLIAIVSIILCVIWYIWIRKSGVWKEITDKICPICNARINKNADYCEYCGKTFSKPITE